MYIEQQTAVSANQFLKQTKMSLKIMSVSAKMEKIILEVPVNDLGRLELLSADVTEAELAIFKLVSFWNHLYKKNSNV